LDVGLQTVHMFVHELSVAWADPGGAWLQ